MKSVLAAAAMSLVISDFANAEETRGKAMMKIEPSAISEADIRSVSPALARFGREAITEDLWTRDALSPRDRSVVTVAMLIARNQPAELKHYIDVALDSGVTPAELSEIITHLAFYSGWPNAMSAVSVIKAVFETRGVTADALPEASPDLLPLNQEAEKQRSETVEKKLALQSSAAGSAQNVGIQILDRTGEVLILDGATFSAKTDLIDGTNILPFQARYIALGQSVAGTANADATFKVQYL